MESKNSLLDELKIQHEQNKLLLAIIDAIPDPIVAKNWDGNFIFANKSCAELYNTTPEKMIGHDDGYFMGNQEQSDFFRENVQKIMLSGEPEVVYEESTDAKTGEVRYYNSHKIPFKDINQNTNITVIAKDVTEITTLKIRAEENEKRLNYVLEATQEGIWDWNIETNEVFHNAYWGKLAGIQNTIFHFDEFFDCVHPDDKKKVKEALNQALKDRLSYNVRFRLVHPDGNVIWIQDRGKVVETNLQNEPIRMVGSAYDVTKEVENTEKIKQLAFFDALTGLPNRRSLQDRLFDVITEHANHKMFGSLLFLDLDNFKMINDTHSHYMGDVLLLEVAKRIEKQLDSDDMVARFGGDEFIIILNNLSMDSETASFKALEIAQSIKQAISESIMLTNEKLAVTIEYEVATSIGVVMFPLDYDNSDELLKLADLALYKAKDTGRNNVVLFKQSMFSDLEKTSLMQRNLKEAIQNDALYLFYQPQYDSNLTLIGAEALVRWFDKAGNMIMPNDFIGLAEESDLIIPMGLNLLEKACLQLKQWSENPKLKHLSIAVNVSAKQVWDKDFVENFSHIIKTQCVDSTLLIIEITESIMVRSMSQTIKKLVELKKLGIKISLDDFGTGYSSLSYLKRLPVDEIKIDASFIRDIVEDSSDLMMVKSILDLGMNFNVNVIAEGVENSQQMQLLQEMNMPHYQGFLLSKPLPISEFETLVLTENI
ncbi:hypothetical protein JCM30760_12660 [Thiomicrorhabdus hydrogeniphila]